MTSDKGAERIFPDEWYWEKSLWDGALVTGEIRCFARPDFSSFQNDKLTDGQFFKRLLMSMRDFSHAKSAITFLQEDVDWEAKYDLAELRRFEAYETSLVVAYARPFSESKGGLPRLSYGGLGVKLDKLARSIHEDLIGKRNRIYAHSDFDAIDHAPPFIMRMKRDDGSEFSVMHPPRFMEGLLFERAEIMRISVLVDCASDAVQYLAQEMHKNFLDDYAVHEVSLDR